MIHQCDIKDKFNQLIFRNFKNANQSEQVGGTLKELINVAIIRTELMFVGLIFAHLVQIHKN